MGSLVVVAIPDENDRVWKVSSEKIPHLTILYLGEDAEKVPNVSKITEFVEHAANTILRRFYLPVDRRDELGDDKADVLFFKKNRYDFKAINDFRMALLKDANIKSAYDAAPQFEGPWKPHLTLGYPTSPANKMPDDYVDSFYDVSFNKIAVWTGDSEGPEFLLKDPWEDFDEMMETLPMDVAMSDISGDTLEHYGIKGMKWGVRNKRPLPTAVTPSAKSVVPHGDKKKTKIEVEGGQNHGASPDALRVAEAHAKLVKSGTAALSNKELQELQTRLNLERNVSQLVKSQSRISRGRQFVRDVTGLNKELNDTLGTSLNSVRLAKQVR